MAMCSLMLLFFCLYFSLLSKLIDDFCVSVFVLLGLIKQFTKVLYGDCFSYMYQSFPELTMEKLKLENLMVLRTVS